VSAFGLHRATTHVPSLDGATAWLNSEPLGPAELRGRVVLVNFWTLTCINWLRQEPYVRAWSQAYRGDGLVVIGVHTPEFSFEHEMDGVRLAAKERGIDYPVAVDNDYEIWSAFDNHYWPALYFVDADSAIRDRHFGEGRYEQSERVIQRLLGVERELVPVQGLGVEARADWDNLRTPETYLGSARGERRVDEPPGAPARQPLGARRRVDDRAREGGARPGRREHRLPLRPARRASAAIARSAQAESLPRAARRRGSGPAHGVDVDEDGNGLLEDGRLYQLVRQHDPVRERTLEIAFSERGVEAYAFTFGWPEMGRLRRNTGGDLNG
jgi:thiol-disulfide isomerase/thioredoxin